MTALLRIALAAALLLTGFAPAGAQSSIPTGSYLQSCTNVRARGPILGASCTAPNGARVQSELNFPSCGGRDIGNVNGYLRCSGGGAGGGFMDGGRIPGGSYQASCLHIRVRMGTLIATCSAANGALVKSSIPLGACRRDADIGNNNGRLSCNN